MEPSHGSQLPLAIDAKTSLWLYKPNAYTLETLIDGGSFGKVFKGRLNDCVSEVAVKRVTNVDLKLLQREVDLLVNTGHPSLLRFIGVCLLPGSTVDIITELCERGSLNAVIKAARDDPHTFHWQTRLNLLMQAAQGMACLHSKDILHRDLKSPNLLVDRHWNCKVADFGLSRWLDPADGSGIKLTEGVVSNPMWLAPELCKGETNSKETDVYSFGIIMWEMMTLQTPFEELGLNPVAWTCQVISYVMEGKRPSIPPDAELAGGTFPGLTDYQRLMCKCWHHDPKQRGTFTEIARQLRAVLNAELARTSQQHVASNCHACPLTPDNGDTTSINVALQPAPDADPCGCAQGSPGPSCEVPSTTSTSPFCMPTTAAAEEEVILEPWMGISPFALPERVGENGTSVMQQQAIEQGRDMVFKTMLVPLPLAGGRLPSFLLQPHPDAEPPSVSHDPEMSSPFVAHCRTQNPTSPVARLPSEYLTSDIGHCSPFGAHYQTPNPSPPAQQASVYSDPYMDRWPFSAHAPSAHVATVSEGVPVPAFPCDAQCLRPVSSVERGERPASCLCVGPRLVRLSAISRKSVSHVISLLDASGLAQEWVPRPISSAPQPGCPAASCGGWSVSSFEDDCGYSHVTGAPLENRAPSDVLMDSALLDNMAHKPTPHCCAVSSGVGVEGSAASYPRINTAGALSLDKPAAGVPAAIALPVHRLTQQMLFMEKKWSSEDSGSGLSDAASACAGNALQVKPSDRIFQTVVSERKPRRRDLFLRLLKQAQGEGHL